ncbi:glycosyltransferase family 2 protein [Delftia acidovorans]|uniref:glycosyltransferase family 2 protein n=1 Tax=Delftia acidovorans TaxID=80866 RepID=UPI001EE1192E|nr:glycosyltransferase family 2 protein [Delftia acidovorans]MCG3780534.1 glycosyltransferase family 2 protein [Delftia acidovorans]
MKLNKEDNKSLCDFYENPDEDSSDCPTAILMSTFNGAGYVLEQVESIILQMRDCDRLFIRDDGSLDNTADLIGSIKDSRIVFVCGENIGFSKSFLWLISNIENAYSIYMLADQDDIWLPGKLLKARRALKNRNEPCLYCSRLQLVDQQMKPIGLSPDFKKPPVFWNAVCENIATGCTTAVNRKALDVLRSIPYEMLRKFPIVYHDWWMYLCISAFGTVIFDKQPSMLYRQHGGNMVGMGAGLGRYKNIMRLLWRRPWCRIMILQLKTFYVLFNKRLKNERAKDFLCVRNLTSGHKLKIVYEFLKCKSLVRQGVGGVWVLKFLLVVEYLSGRLDITDIHLE